MEHHEGNENQNYNEISHVRMFITKKQQQQITSVGKDVEKRELSCTVDRNVNWYSHYGKQCGDSSINSNSTPGYLSEEIKNTN